MKRIFCCFLLAVLIGCGRKNFPSNTRLDGIRLAAVIEVPHRHPVHQTIAGGLSGIDYDSQSGLLYMISDDRSQLNPARFYTARLLQASGSFQLEWQAVDSFRQEDGTLFPSAKTAPQTAPDPEAIRVFRKENTLIWTSEGERRPDKDPAVYQDPFIAVAGMDGKTQRRFVLPPNLRISSLQKGPRNNGVFEGLSIDPSKNEVWVSLEEPLLEDGNAATVNNAAWVRLTRFDYATGKQSRQYAYQIDPVVHAPVPADSFSVNGISEILYLGNEQMLVVERSFSYGRQGSSIRVYLTDLKGASDVRGVFSLARQKGWQPVSKKLVLDMDSLGIYIDNVEGLSWGPRLSNGKQSLLFVTDDNFSKDQKTQLLVFELN